MKEENEKETKKVRLRTEFSSETNSEDLKTSSEEGEEKDEKETKTKSGLMF